MELHQLRYFVAVAETGGFIRAAERCGVTQPSLSQQVRKLEGELGVTLFDRSSRGAVPTEAGRALLPRAQRILAEVRWQIERDGEYLSGCSFKSGMAAELLRELSQSSRTSKG